MNKSTKIEKEIEKEIEEEVEKEIEKEIEKRTLEVITILSEISKSDFPLNLDHIMSRTQLSEIKVRRALRILTHLQMITQTYHIQ